MFGFAPPVKKPSAVAPKAKERWIPHANHAAPMEGSLGPERLLDPRTRTRMESLFSHDFGAVCVHADAHAASAARANGSLAFTVANRVVFGQGQYRPDTVFGEHLIAHELAHVVQQTRGGGSGIPSARSEAEADRAGAAAASARYANGKNVIGFTGSFDRYIAAHHFFVAEIAHELFE